MTDYYIDEIARIARENIKKGVDAGCGMYNFDLWLDKTIQGKKYKDSAILQIYPYADNDFYGLTYLLCYYCDYGSDNFEHDDYAFDKLTDEEQEYVFNEFKKQIGTNTMEKNNNLLSFVKEDITFEEKLKLISDWEEERGSDGEYIYDLDDDTDAQSWIMLYSAETLYKCRKEGRYWLGGSNFSCKGWNIKGNSTSAWCITEEKMEDFFKNQLIPEIEDRYNIWITDNYARTREEKLKYAKQFGNFFHELIDFEGFCRGENPIKYKWVGVSNDLSFQDYSTKVFDTEKDCYNDMRNSALEKIKWNTEYTDIDCDGSYIHYEVNFFRDKITHLSYSGYYVYKIVPEDTIINLDYYKEFAKEENKGRC